MTYVGFGGLLINVLGLLVIGGHSHSHDTPSLEIVDTTNIGDRASDMSVDSKQNGLYAKSEVFEDERGRLSGADGSHISVYDVQEEDSPGRNCPCFKRRRIPVSDIEHENCHLSQCPTSTKKNSNTEARRLSKAGTKKRSMNMRAVFLHVLADFFGSVIVCVSALLLWFVPGDPEVSPNQWKFYVDPTMSVIMVAIILSSTIPLLRKAALILLQSVPSEICIQNLQSRLEKLDGVRRVHDLHVWKLQSNCIIGTAHIRCRGLTEYVTVARSVKQLFHEYNIHCTTIQPEFEDDEGLEPDTCMYDCGPNRNCQQDTCCPQPASSTSSGNNHTQHGSNSSHTSLAINNITYQSSGNALDAMLATGIPYKSEVNGKNSELKQELNPSTTSFAGLGHSTIEMDHFASDLAGV
uniref:Zinc transporter 10 n=1 Tax=Schistocephalus solidus TaxID=70667 RepID=A0A0X3P6R4_SCHSO